MPLIQELLNKGVVTKRHPTLLEPGEVQQAEDCVYRVFDPSIHRAPGRSEYNSSALGSPSAVKGLAHLTFDNQFTDQLIAHVGTDFYRSDFTALTGSFSAVSGAGQVECNITASAPHLTAASGTPFTTDDIIGARVTGTGIPVGSYVTARNSTSTLTLNTAPSAGSSITVTFDIGVFTALEDQGDEILDAYQWASVYFGLTGRGPSQRLYWRSRPNIGGTNYSEVLVRRAAGLEPVSQLPDTTVATTSGTWNSTLGNGAYWFLITEAMDPDSPNEVEGAYNGKPVAVTITSYTTQAVLITFPTQINNGARGRVSSHWMVYMSPRQPDANSVPSLALFRRVGVFPIGSATATLQDAVTYQEKLPTTSASADGRPDFTDPSGFFQKGGQQAKGKSGSSTSGSENDTPVSALGTFGFSTGSPYNVLTVVGVEITVNGRREAGGNASKAAGYYVRCGTSSKTTENMFQVFTSEDLSSHTFGGAFNTMGVAWVPSDFADGTFTCTIGKQGTGARQRIRIDYVQVKVYYTGTTINLDGRPYRVVTYRSQIGTTVNDPANFPPPEANTADVFRGHVVSNDLGDEEAVAYSLAGFPEYFPKPYRLQFQSRKKDRVTMVRRVGQVLVVGMRDSIKRVNYLPTEVDTDFQQGLAHEDLVSDHGMVGPLAATMFDMGTGPVLAYVSLKGVHVTDGITSHFLNIDLDWENTVDISKLGTCVLRTYTKENWLVLFYTPPSVTHSHNTRALIFQYSPDKVKDGFLPVIGPIKVAARASCEAILNGQSYLLTGHNSLGKVYIEDQGLTLPATYTVLNAAGSEAAVTIVPTIKTRLFYPAGLGRQAREQRVYMMVSANGSTLSISSTTTSGSATVTSSAAFANVLPGMLVTGTGIPVETVVLSKSDSSTITLSKNATASGTVSLSYDSGTVSLGVRGQDIGAAISALETVYSTTRVGGLLVVHPDNMKESLEVLISKVVLPNSSTAALDVAFRLHYFAYMVTDAGQETNTA